nr:hypothetical protein Iba_chr10cCG9090 [Ipomoea batatas]
MCSNGYGLNCCIEGSLYSSYENEGEGAGCC